MTKNPTPKLYARTEYALTSLTDDGQAGASGEKLSQIFKREALRAGVSVTDAPLPVGGSPVRNFFVNQDTPFSTAQEIMGAVAEILKVRVFIGMPKDLDNREYASQYYNAEGRDVCAQKAASDNILAVKP